MTTAVRESRAIIFKFCELVELKSSNLLCSTESRQQVFIKNIGFLDVFLGQLFPVEGAGNENNLHFLTVSRYRSFPLFCWMTCLRNHEVKPGPAGPNIEEIARKHSQARESFSSLNWQHG